MNHPLPEALSDWTHRVSYGETDAMQVAYYGHYLHWFEQARSHFIRERGMSYAGVEAKGVFLPVREASCRYRRPARFDQRITVRTWITSTTRASLTFAYQVLDEEETLLAEGRTEHACVDSSGKPVRLPEWLLALVRAHGSEATGVQHNGQPSSSLQPKTQNS
jgi:acyl-CoA thioester hydrolase